jgi:hypothetical protein
MSCRFTVRCVLLISLLCSLASCSKIVYDGPTYPATQKVVVYYDAREIPKEYETMGLIKASGSGLFSGSNLESKLIKQACQKGADAILFEVSGESTTERRVTQDERGMGKLSASEKTKWVKAYLLKFK